MTVEFAFGCKAQKSRKTDHWRNQCYEGERATMLFISKSAGVLASQCVQERQTLFCREVDPQEQKNQRTWNSSV